jgi:hypothetical protein
MQGSLLLLHQNGWVEMLKLLVCNCGVFGEDTKRRLNNWSRYYLRIALLKYLSLNDNLFPIVTYSLFAVV